MLNQDEKDKIKHILLNDGVIAFVTDTVWGLGCLPESEKAVKKIYSIKNREAENLVEEVVKNEQITSNI